MLKNLRKYLNPQERAQLYGAIGRVDSNALRVLALLPKGRVTRTRDAIQIDDGDDPCISVLVTAEAIEFRLPTVEWPHPGCPMAATELWNRELVAKLLDEQLISLIFQARQARLDQFINCRFCQRSVPPEYRHADVCHGCAEEHLGILH